MAIGKEDEFSFFIVEATDDPPSSEGEFIDYSGNFIKWNVKGSVSELSQFQGTMAGDFEGDNNIKRNNYMYVLSGKTLIGKFRIDQPKFNNDFTCEIKASQSTGSELLYRDLKDEITEKVKFEQERLDNIFTRTDGGLLVDQAGNTILSLGSIEGADNRYNIEFDYDKRIQALSDLCIQANKEWEIVHGANDDSPFSEGDELQVLNRIGSSSSTYTFDLSGSNMDCSSSSNNNELDSAINDCIVEGTDQNGAQIEARIYDSATNVSYTDGAIDGWLYENVSGAEDVMLITVTNPFSEGETITGDSSGSTAVLLNKVGSDNGEIWETYNISGDFTDGETITGDLFGSGVFERWYGQTSEEAQVSNALHIKVNKGSGFFNYGTDFVVKIDSELIRVNSAATSTDYDYLYIYSRGLGASVSGRGISYISTLGDTYKSKPASHTSGSDVIMMGHYDGTTYDYFDIVLDDSLIMPSSGDIRVGSEIMTVQDRPTTTTLRLANRGRKFAGSYAHGDGIRVIDADYTPENPQSNSTIDSLGPISQALTERFISFDALDRKAQNVIENRSEPENIEIQATDAFDVWNNVGLGDTVTLTNTRSTNISDGDYRIMGFKYSYDHGRISLEFDIGREGKRTWTGQTNNFIKSLDESNQPKIQKPIRNSEKFNFTQGEGDEQNFSMPSQFKNVIDPTDPEDAATKRYVDSKVSGSSGGGGESYWERPGSYVRPINSDDNVLPNGNSQLGQEGTEWNSIYTSYYLSGGPVCYHTNYYDGPNSFVFSNSKGNSTLLQVDGNVEPQTDNANRLGNIGVHWSSVFSDKFETRKQSTAWVTQYIGKSTHSIRNDEYGYDTDLILYGNFLPNSDASRDIGSTGFHWRRLFIENVNVGNAVAFLENPNNALIRGDEYLGSVFEESGSDVAAFYLGGVITYVPLLAKDYLDVAGESRFNSDVYLGNASGDDIYVQGRIKTDFDPDTDGYYDMGADSLRWNYIYCYYINVLNNATFRSGINVSEGVSALGDSVFSADLRVGWNLTVDNDIDVSGRIDAGGGIYTDYELYTGDVFNAVGLSWFYSDVQMYEDLDVDGTLSKSSGSFKIDNPENPKNEYLYHQFSESPEALLQYRFVIDTNKKTEFDNGHGWKYTATPIEMEEGYGVEIELPSWFKYLTFTGDNHDDFCCHITGRESFIGESYASFKELGNNKLIIVTEKPGKASVLLEATRHDPFYVYRPMDVVEEKPDDKKGKFRNYKAYDYFSKDSVYENDYKGDYEMSEEEFKKELESIKGIGKKTSRDVMQVYTRKELVETIQKGERLPFDNDIEEKLKSYYNTR